MKASELKEKSVADLKAELEELLKQQFKYRMEQGTGQLTQTHKLRSVRRNIARVRTVIGEKQRAGSES